MWHKEEEMEESRPGINPLIGSGIRPLVPRFNHWEGFLGNNNYRYVAQGRSRSFPAPPQLDKRRQPHNQPCCLTAGFGYVAPNAQFPPRLNFPSPHVPNPPCHLPCPLLPLPKIRLTQKKPKVPPQDLILRVVTPLRPIVAALKVLFLQFIFFLVYYFSLFDYIC